MIWSLPLLILGFPDQPSVSEMVARRIKEVKTADIRWLLHTHSRRSSSTQEDVYYRATISPNGVVHRRVAGPDGVVQRHLLGKSFSACAEEYYLLKNGLLWSRKSVSPSGGAVDVNGRADRADQYTNVFQDPRLFGILPFPVFGVRVDNLHTKITIEDGRILYQDMLQLMVLEYTMGEHGWPVRIDVSNFIINKNGERKVAGGYSDHIKYKKYAGGVYFPILIERHHKRGRVGTSWKITAVVNDPKHARELWPEDVGFMEGMPVRKWTSANWDCHYAGRGQLMDKASWRLYAKEQKASDPNWNQEYRKFCNHWRANRERSRWPDWVHDKQLGVDQADLVFVGAWEMYVRRFCLMYRLDEKQRNSAYAVLRGCHKQAEPLRQKMSDGEKGVEQKLIDLFNKGLVPRLDAILTEPQRVDTMSSLPTKSKSP